MNRSLPITSRITVLGLLFSTALVWPSGAAPVTRATGGNSFNLTANGAVRVAVAQPDGRIVIGGDFTTITSNNGVAVTRNRMARLNADGSLDLAFDPNANGSVETIAVQADGNILAGGQFTAIGRQKRNRIARLNFSTGLADWFDPNSNERVYAIAVQTDGKIVVGGVFDSIGGQLRRHLARLDAATGLADAFDPSPDAFGVYMIALQTDGKILVGGFFRTIGGERRNSLARLDPMTGLADSFDPQASSINKAVAVFHAITIQADGRIIVGGEFGNIGGQIRNRIARLDPITGRADPFDPDASGAGSDPHISAIAVQTDGQVLVGGAFTNIGGQPRNHLARLDPTTGLADSFDPSPDALGVYAIAVGSDGQILAGGAFHKISGKNSNYIAALDPNANDVDDGNTDSNTPGSDDATSTSVTTPHQ